MTRKTLKRKMVSVLIAATMAVSLLAVSASAVSGSQTLGDSGIIGYYSSDSSTLDAYMKGYSSSQNTSVTVQATVQISGGAPTQVVTRTGTYEATITGMGTILPNTSSVRWYVGGLMYFPNGTLYLPNN